jgi:hypothetical protein
VVRGPQFGKHCPTRNNKRKANWIGHILRRNCHLQQVIEGKIKGEIKVTGRRRSSRKLLVDLKERRGYSHDHGLGSLVELRFKVPPGTSIYHHPPHRDNVTASHGRPNLRSRLHFGHNREGRPRSP